MKKNPAKKQLKPSGKEQLAIATVLKAMRREELAAHNLRMARLDYLLEQCGAKTIQPVTGPFDARTNHPMD